MSIAYVPIKLFDEEKFEQCIVVPFPEGGKIVDTVMIDKTAYVLVEVHPNAKVITAHFHVIPALLPIYVDGHEYVGMFKIEDFRGVPLSTVIVIRVTAGDFGIHSAEYQALHGDQKSVTNEPTIQSSFSNDDELRKLWDFLGADKTDDNENPETETEL